MTTDVETASRHEREVPKPSRGALYAFLAGLGLAVAAALLLWAHEGSEVFLTQAFAALAACF